MISEERVAVFKTVVANIYSHCLFHLLCACPHNIHCFSNCIHTHLIKAIGHEDKVGTAESKLCNEQKQIHSKSIMSCELCEVALIGPTISNDPPGYLSPNLFLSVFQDSKLSDFSIVKRLNIKPGTVNTHLTYVVQLDVTLVTFGRAPLHRTPTASYSVLQSVPSVTDQQHQPTRCHACETLTKT